MRFRFAHTSAYGGLRRIFNVLLPILLLVWGTPAPAQQGASPIRILALGDSLTAGYGVQQGLAFTDRLEKALIADGIAAKIINAGVSGDTTAGGAGRLGWLMSEKPDAAIVELGANDALRGIDPADTRRNLSTILDSLKQAGIPVLLTGMLAPPNLGSEYGEAFNSIYPDLAEQYEILFYPFFLEGVAAVPSLNQQDGIHPNPAGVEEVVSRILPYVKQLALQARGRRG